MPYDELEGDAGVPDPESSEYPTQGPPEPVEPSEPPEASPFEGEAPPGAEGAPDATRPISAPQGGMSQGGQGVDINALMGGMPSPPTGAYSRHQKYLEGQMQGQPIPSLPQISSAEEAAAISSQIGEQVFQVEDMIRQQGGTPTLGQVNALEQLHAQQSMVNAAGMKHEVTQTMNKLHEAQQDFARRKEVAEKGRQERLNQRFMDYEKAIQGLDNTGFDTMRFYKENGAMAAIAVLFGGLGRAFSIRATGRDPGNSAVQMLDRLVEMDIQNQKMEIARKQTGVGMAQNAIGILQQQLGSEREAEEVYKIAALSKLENEIAALGTKWNLADRQQEASALMQNIRSKNMGAQNKLAHLAFQMDAQKSAMVYQDKMYKYQMAMSSIQQQRAASIPGLVLTGETSPSKTDIAQVKKIITMVHKTGPSLATLQKHFGDTTNQPGWIQRSLANFGFGSKEAVSVQEAAKQLLQIIKSPEFANLGAAVTENEMELFLTNPKSRSLSSDFYRRLELSLQNVFGGVQNTLGMYGYAMDPNEPAFAPMIKLSNQAQQRMREDLSGDMSGTGIKKVR